MDEAGLAQQTCAIALDERKKRRATKKKNLRMKWHWHAPGGAAWLSRWGLRRFWRWQRRCHQPRSPWRRKWLCHPSSDVIRLVRSLGFACGVEMADADLEESGFKGTGREKNCELRLPLPIGCPRRLVGGARWCPSIRIRTPPPRHQSDPMTTFIIATRNVFFFLSI